jgi:phospholipase/carboxylesterase
MKGLKAAFITVLLMLITLICLAQETQSFTKPEDIDIYKFDPLQGNTVDSSQLVSKAYELYQKADYENAARYYLVYLQNAPDDATSWYNLSCCYGLLGNAEYAAKYLKIAYKKGFTDVGHVEQDTDFTKVKAEKDFVNAVDSLKTWNEKKAYYTGTMEYFKTEHFIPYWVHFPKNYDKTKPATLLIGLHGYGDKAYNFSYIWKYIEDANVIFVVPEAPYPFVEGNDAAFSWGPFAPMESKISQEAYDMVNDYILDLQKYMKSKYKIEQNWLMGFSQGAYFGYMLALKNPKEFDGLLACGGGLVTDVFKESDYKKAKNVTVIISHGKQDTMVPFEEATKAYDILKGKGFNVELQEFEGGHRVSPDGMKLFLDYIR